MDDSETKFIRFKDLFFGEKFFDYNSLAFSLWIGSATLNNADGLVGVFAVNLKINKPNNTISLFKFVLMATNFWVICSLSCNYNLSQFMIFTRGLI